MIFKTEEQSHFYKKALLMILPMALQNLINVGVTMADVVMLGRVSETALSGASLGGQVYFVVSLFLFGITSGASVLTAQYWGQRNLKVIEQILAFAMRIGVIVAFIFSLLVLFFPTEAMRIFSNDAAVIEAGAQYLEIVAFSYVLSAITTVYLLIMRSVERVYIATAVYFASFLLNIVLNAIFIYGLLGAPAMGVRGAALGTLLSRIFELVVMLCYAIFRNKEIRLRFRYLFHVEKWIIKDFFKYASPVIVNELLWGSAVSVNAAIIGHLGQSATAANAVAQMSRQMAMVVSFGVSAAAAIMIGKVIGEGKFDAAKVYAARFIKLSVITGVAGGILLFILRPLLVSTMVTSADAKSYLSTMLIILVFYVICMSYTCNMIVGIYRAGGDTKVGMIFDVGTMWFISIPMALFAAFVMKWPVQVVYIFMMSDEFIKFFLTTVRYKQGKWLKVVTRN